MTEDGPDSVIVRYGEIFLKSSYVRNMFTGMLAVNIRHRLLKAKIDAKLSLGHHRLYLSTDRAQEAAKAVSSVLGVKSASPAYSSEPSFEAMSERALSICGGSLGGGSFSVRAKRSKDYPIKSTELEKRLGALIVGTYGNRVDLTNPSKTVHVEVNMDGARIFFDSFEGVGGMPYGSQSTVACVVGDLDGALSCFMMMRRGCKVAYVGDGKYIGKLNEYANPDIRAYGSLEEAVSGANALGVVLGETFHGFDASRDAGFDVPVYRPLFALPPDEVGRFLRMSGL